MDKQIHALYAGTFDPPTFGHLSIIKKGAYLFDHLTIGIGMNEGKAEPLLTREERLEILKGEVEDFSNVTVEVFDGLLVNFAHKIQATLLVRGVRNSIEFEEERQRASANYHLSTPHIETLFLTAEETSWISSSLIRELIAHKGNLSPFIPKRVIEKL